MRKLLLVAATGMVALSLGGCGGDGGSGGDTASPTPSPTNSPASPTPTTQGSPSPGSPNNPQAFPSPVVTQQPNLVASVPGLIQSTNPDERAKQAQSDIDTKNRNSRTTPLTQPSPNPKPNAVGSDPFSVLPPQPLRISPDAAGGTPNLPKQPDQTVPDLPDVPSLINPPQWTRPRIPRIRGGGGPSGPFPPGGGGGPSGPFSPGGGGDPSGPFSPDGSSSPKLPSGNGTGIPDLPKQPIAAGPPQWRTPTSPAGRPSGPTIPRLPKPPNGTGIPDLPKQPVNQAPPAWQDPNPPRRPTPSRPVAPPPPSTALAQAVEVTGVVRVGNQILVILRAPNEPTSRYVRVGQRIANGQVLVKRVQFRTDSDPIVILEENGVEVQKVVGEKTASAQDKPSNP